MSPREAPPRGRGNERSQYAYWLMRAHPEWEVLNRGVNGERSDEVRARFEEDVVAAQPRAVIVIAGVNDVYQGLDTAHAIGHLRWMYERAGTAGLALVAGTVVPYNTATADQNRRMHGINEWIRACGVAFADTRAAVASAASPDLLADSADGLHPSADGYRRMAEAIRPVLERVLAEFAHGGR
jgi:lysophospholipase L1-like esterase